MLHLEGGDGVNSHLKPSEGTVMMSPAWQVCNVPGNKYSFLKHCTKFAC